MTALKHSSIALRLGAGALVAAGAAACGEDGGSEACTPGPGVICTFMGNGFSGLGQDGVGATEVRLSMPQDLLVDDEGTAYVLDWNNHRIRTLKDGVVNTLAGTGTIGDASNGYGSEVALNHPTHATFNPLGRLVVSAWHNSKVLAIDIDTAEVRGICGTGARAYGGDDGPADKAVLNLPVATVFDSDGRMVIMDQANQRVRRIEADGTIHTIVGPGPEWEPEGTTKLCSTNPQGIETCKICKDEEAGDPSCTPVRPMGFEGDGGPATEALLSLSAGQRGYPFGRIDLGGDDSIYIADTQNHRVRKVSPDGTIETVAGTGPAEYDPRFAGGYEGDGGPATAAKLRNPTDVEVLADGSFYIADTFNHCVRYVDAAGKISTAAGRCGERGSEGDGGPATEALLDWPYGIETDAQGNLYIADTRNHRIRVVYK